MANHSRYKKISEETTSSNLNVLQCISIDTNSNSHHVFSVETLANLAIQPRTDPIFRHVNCLLHVFTY